MWNWLDSQTVENSTCQISSACSISAPRCCYHTFAEPSHKPKCPFGWWRGGECQGQRGQLRASLLASRCRYSIGCSRGWYEDHNARDIRLRAGQDGWGDGVRVQDCHWCTGVEASTPAWEPVISARRPSSNPEQHNFCAQFRAPLTTKFSTGAAELSRPLELQTRWTHQCRPC